jgi:hypothetical protein
VALPRLTTSHPDLIRYEGTRAYVDLHPGQTEAMDATERFVFIYAGTGGGKTSFLPWWLEREIRRTADPRGGTNDYLAATASYDLFKLKFLPEMLKVFEQILRLARFWSGSKILELADPSGTFWAKTADSPMWGRIILRSAQAEGGLESSTARAVVLDECGMDDFRVDHWEAVQRRLSLSQGRVLGATTLYNRGWTKSEIWDRWRRGEKDYRVINFPSYMNPRFPRAEFERMEAILPRWKMNMFYRGLFDVPEGLIYQPFDSEIDVCDDFEIPADWPRWGALDFGGVNTGAICIAERPSDKHLFLAHEYLAGGKTTAQHAAHLLGWSCRGWWGGAASEDQWRREFAAAGMPVAPPLTPDVEVGIQSVYAVLAQHHLTVMRSCRRWLDEVGTYARKTDKAGQTTEAIQDKQKFHLMDCTRYLLGTIRRPAGEIQVVRLG